MQKTNVMRILDKEKIQYNCYEYAFDDGLIDGVSVAAKINKPAEMVYKTLITKSSHNYYCFIIQVGAELNLKAAAAAVSEKSVEMLKPTLLKDITGYIRGGCSPIGLKKPFVTVIDESAVNMQNIIISAGKIGVQVEIETTKLVNLTNAKILKVQN